MPARHGSRHNREANALLSAILASPGDKVARFAMADWVEGQGMPEAAGCLRTAGSWNIVWNSESRDWRLWWRSERPFAGPARPCIISLADLYRASLPRCGSCKRRAHYSAPPCWKWYCSKGCEFRDQQEIAPHATSTPATPPPAPGNA